MNTVVFEGGSIGVDFFFVLSGFLITYLLAFEQVTTGKINARNYFLRRSLRIWPLYFAGVFIAYANNFLSGRLSLGNASGYDPNLLFSLTFLENYQMIFHDNFPNGAPLRAFWSLCVEEHFYMLWLLLFLWIPRRHIIKALCSLWIIGVVYRLWFYWQFPHKDYYDIDVISKLDYFCAGGMAGFMIATRGEAVSRFVKQLPAVIRYGWTIAAIIFFFTFHLYVTTRVADLYIPIISAPLFAGLLLTIATSATFIHFSEKNIISRLGAISYGIYVFHTIVTVVLLALVKRAGINITTTGNQLVFMATAFGITVLISRLSWLYFESYFLKRRNYNALKA